MLFGRSRRRRRALDQPFPQDWRALLTRAWPRWSALTVNERERLEALIRMFIAERRWEPANNFEITDEMRVLVAAQACLLVLEIGLDWYARTGSIILHPGTMMTSGERRVGATGLVADAPEPIDGQAHFEGSVLLSWPAVAYETRHPYTGRNVVYHEFAHQLDMDDGLIDGTPSGLDDDLRQRWVEVCTAEYDAVRRGQSITLRDYAGTDPGEFFAVATETFFATPHRVRDGNPALYAVLSEFYAQDPASR